MPSESQESASEFVKIPQVTALYRNVRTGKYYGAKKVNGRRKERSLGTTDWKIAERRLKDWIASLDRVDHEVEKTTLEVLNQRFLAVCRGTSDSTYIITSGVLDSFEQWWPCGGKIEVRNVRTSHLEEWLASHERRLKNTSYNRYAGVLKQLFEMAVNDRIISESPFERVRTRWKRPQNPRQIIPTPSQFEGILAMARRWVLIPPQAEGGEQLEGLR